MSEITGELNKLLSIILEGQLIKFGLVFALIFIEMEVPMNIYQALKEDHEELLGLLDELCSLDKDDDYRFTLIEEIRDNLIPHSRAEESVFYNTLRALNADNKKVMHGYQEHLEAETLLRALQVMDKMNLDWIDTALKLRKALSHHIREEETEIFAIAQEVFSDEESEAMAEAFLELKPKIEEQGFLKNSFDMVRNLMPPRLADKMKDMGEGRPS